MALGLIVHAIRPSLKHSLKLAITYISAESN